MSESGFGGSALSTARPVFGEWTTVRLNGSQYMQATGLTVDEFGADWTVCGWFNQDGAALEVLADLSDGTANERITVSVTAAGAIEVTQVDTAGANTNTLTTTETGLASGVWHHVTVTRSANLFEVYLNGGAADATTMTVATRPASMDRLFLGDDRGTSTGFTGYMSQWMIHSRALTVDQVSRYSGSAYGNAQKARGRHDWVLNFNTLTSAPFPSLDLGRWPTSTHGAAPAHQWLTLPWVDTTVFGDQGTDADWALTAVGVSDWRLEKGYYDGDISSLSPYSDLIDPTTGSDWGFGDPDPDPVAPHDPGVYAGDTGFGSSFVYAPMDAGQVQLLAPLSQYGDDGGYVVEVLADWPEPGPYRFRFRDEEGAVFPADTFCYSGIATQGFRCYSLTGGVDVIRFISPACPPGVYRLIIQWGPDFGSELEVYDTGPTVVTRNRGLEIYALRRRLPEHYRSGPVVSRQDDLIP